MEKAHKICVEMLNQREYKIITDEDDKIVATKPDGKNMIVFFSGISKFNVKNMQVFITVMNDLDIFHAIIIYKDGITAFTKKAIDQSIEMKFELFAEEDLQYNITKHALQPEFNKITVTEAEQLKTNYGSKFPILRHDDPIRRFYNFEKNDIIKITRKSGYITYRLVK